MQVQTVCCNIIKGSYKHCPARNDKADTGSKLSKRKSKTAYQSSSARKHFKEVAPVYAVFQCVGNSVPNKDKSTSCNSDTAELLQNGSENAGKPGREFPRKQASANKKHSFCDTVKPFIKLVKHREVRFNGYTATARSSIAGKLIDFIESRKGFARFLCCTASAFDCLCFVVQCLCCVGGCLCSRSKQGRNEPSKRSHYLRNNTHKRNKSRYKHIQ